MTKFQKIVYALLTLSALLYAISFAFGQYVRAKEHNADLYRWCLTNAREDFKGADPGEKLNTCLKFEYNPFYIELVQ